MSAARVNAQFSRARGTDSASGGRMPLLTFLNVAIMGVVATLAMDLGYGVGIGMAIPVFVPS